MADVYRLTRQMRDADVARLVQTYPDEGHYDLLLGGLGEPAADVYTPAGELLLKYRPAALSAGACSLAWDGLIKAARVSYNRATVTGVGPKRIRPDGTPARTQEANPGLSGFAGFVDRSQRQKYCRMTAFSRDHLGRWGEMMPMVREADAVFAREYPDRYAAQMAAVARTRPEWVVPGTAFTTVTVNRNLRTRCHYDAGDLRAGFGVISMLRAGEFGGGYLVFPKYRVAVDLQSRDVLLADVHELHGNTAIVGVPGEFDRVSCVYYFWENMTECGTPKEEMLRAVDR